MAAPLRNNNIDFSNYIRNFQEEEAIEGEKGKVFSFEVPVSILGKVDVLAHSDAQDMFEGQDLSEIMWNDVAYLVFPLKLGRKSSYESDSGVPDCGVKEPKDPFIKIANEITILMKEFFKPHGMNLEIKAYLHNRNIVCFLEPLDPNFNQDSLEIFCRNLNIPFNDKRKESEQKVE